MGIFTELSILYSKYAPPKRERIFHSIYGLLKSMAVMEHLKLFVARINIKQVIVHSTVQSRESQEFRQGGQNVGPTSFRRHHLRSDMLIRFEHQINRRVRAETLSQAYSAAILLGLILYHLCGLISASPFLCTSFVYLFP
jgi:hypothetical protein